MRRIHLLLTPSRSTMRVLLLLALFVPAWATAQTCTTSWATAADGDWFDEVNWTDGLPTADDTACIDAPGTYTVTTNDGFALPLAGLVVGGASGTQTLQTTADIDVSGNARVAPNGRVEMSNRGSSNADGINVAGTFLVEGALAYQAFTVLMSEGGTLDIAPGGQFLVDTGIGSVTIGRRSGGVVSTVRVRGRVAFGPSESFARSTSIRGVFELDGGTLAIDTGSLSLAADGTFRDATFEIGTGASVTVTNSNSNGAAGDFTVEGTVSGDIAGTLTLGSGGSLIAGPAGATLDFGGAGLVANPGSGRSASLESAGGAFTNTGRITFGGNGTTMRAVTLRNEGEIDVPNRLTLDAGATLDNAPTGVLALVDGGALNRGPDGGQLVGAGRIIAELGGAASASSQINVVVDLDGAVLASDGARMQLGEGTLRDVDFDVPEGGTITFSTSNNSGSGRFILAGTLSGAPAGTVSLSSSGRFAAAAEGATLNLGGTGLLVNPGSGRSAVLAGAGGVLTNAGFVEVDGNNVRVEETVFRNEGVLRVESRLAMEAGGLVRNTVDGRIEVAEGGGFTSADDTGRLENAGLVEGLQGNQSGTSRSGFGGTLRSLPGSELRTNAGARFDIDAPASQSVPAGVRVTGDGIISLTQSFELEGTISPGTDAQPIDTLEVFSWFFFSRVAGSPQVIIDVDEGGVGDQIAVTRGNGPSFPIRPAGTLIVRVRPGYTPQPGDSFEVIRITNSSNAFQGSFLEVATVGGPAGIAFDAAVNDDGTALVITAREAGTGPVAISPERLVAGDLRRFILSGSGATGVTGARLECTTCADPDNLASIPATVQTANGITTADADLSDARAYGLYDLVVTTTEGEQRVPITIEPFVSILAVGAVGLSRVPIVPEGADTGWASFRAEALTNGPQEIPYFVDLDLPEPFVRVAMSSFSHGNGLFYDRAAAPDPSEAQLVMVPGRNQFLSFSRQAGIDPMNIQFPGEEPRPNTVAFGEAIVFDFVSTDHMSTAAARAALAEALRTTSGGLSDYVAQVDAANASAVGEAVVATLRWAAGQIRDHTNLLAFALAELDPTVATPAGLAAAASEAFGLRLKETTDAAGLNGLEALQAGYASAPELAALIDAVFARISEEVEASSFLAPEAMAQALEMVRLESRVRPQDRIGCPEGGNPGFNNWVNQKRARLSFGLKGSQTIGGSGSSSNPSCDPPGGPFDPNDKTTETTLGCEFGFVEVDGEQVPRCVRYFVPRNRAAEPIEYTIQFENLPEATAPATFVTVTDVLDDDLDPSTLRVLQTSSDSTFSFTVTGQEVVFRFTDINLPPNTTPPIGEGFVTFEVSPRSGLADGTEIVNSADIVFDFNPPIFTPEVVHELRQVADPVVTLFAPEELDTATSLEYTFTFENAGADPAPDALLTITPAASDVQEVRSSSGACEGTRPIVCDFGELAAGASVSVTVTQGPLPEGTTVLRGTATTSVFADTFFNNEASAEITVVGVGVEEEGSLPTAFTLDAVYPNPFTTGATIRYGLPEAAKVEVIVFDLLGREVVRLADDEQAAGWHEASLGGATLASGVYLCQFRAGGVVQTHKVTLVR